MEPPFINLHCKYPGVRIVIDDGDNFSGTVPIAYGKLKWSHLEGREEVWPPSAVETSPLPPYLP